MVKYLLALLVMIICACSNEPDNKDALSQDAMQSGIDNSQALLSSISVLDNIFQSRKYFVSYSRAANRVSIIDTQSETEVAAWRAENYDYVLPLPNFDGIALFAKDRVVIKTAEAQKTFVLANTYNQISAAKKHAMYSMASVDGKSFEVIRYLGDAKWQHETLYVPWKVPDLNVSNELGDQPKPLVTQFYNKGAELIAFSPITGGYAAYTSFGLNAHLGEIVSWCEGVSPQIDTIFPAMASDNGYTFIGDDSGNVYSFISVFQNCVLNANMPLDMLSVIKMNSSAATTHIAFYSSMFGDPILNGQAFGVIQDLPNEYGSFQLVTYEIDFFGVLLGLKRNLYVDNVCETPIGSIKLQDTYVLITCIDVTDTANISSKLIFITLDIRTGEIVNSLSFNKNATASIAIDSDSTLLYRMLEGGFGNLEITNLVNGDSRLVEGLYIKGILD